MNEGDYGAQHGQIEVCERLYEEFGITGESGMTWDGGTRDIRGNFWEKWADNGLGCNMAEKFFV